MNGDVIVEQGTATPLNRDEALQLSVEMLTLFLDILPIGIPTNSTFRVHHGLLAHPIARQKNRWLATLAPLRAPNEGKCSCDPSCWCQNVT